MSNTDFEFNPQPLAEQDPRFARRPAPPIDTAGAQQQQRLPPGMTRTVPPPDDVSLPFALRAQQELYMPAPRNRGATGWGTDYWPIVAAQKYPGFPGGPTIPSPLEMYGVIRGAGGQLARWASPGVAAPAGRASIMASNLAPILDALSKGAFSKNFTAARLGALKIQQEQMVMDAQQA
ncbi:MAG TPA: hypothetical protein VF778_03910, partial [Xanthobacteraceae bacterium]